MARPDPSQDRETPDVELDAAEHETARLETNETDATASEKASVVPPKARKERKKRVPRSRRGGMHDDIARAPAPNPVWYVPVMCGLMIFGLIWVVVFYLSSGQWPIQTLHNWNLLIGFAFIIAGFMMTTNWR